MCTMKRVAMPIRGGESLQIILHALLTVSGLKPCIRYGKTYLWIDARMMLGNDTE